ncbi:hypothetical protein [Streptomyces canus]|uniref:hypothetical protein n=1 Tax=Streptomyces canus TaxID=58343 RepID=UPI002787DEB3|nr:hypothetical protein [Streptomyces canus]MDQ0762027.1 hypothetical protein [Streptomyces canus]
MQGPAPARSATRPPAWRWRPRSGSSRTRTTLLGHYEDAPNEETAEQAEAEPAPAPVNVPTATPAQQRTLEAIRDNGVALQELRVGQCRVTVERGERPRRDMVEWVVGQGWARQARNTSLFDGQAVTLTDIGEAILAR